MKKSLSQSRCGPGRKMNQERPANAKGTPNRVIGNSSRELSFPRARTAGMLSARATATYRTSSMRCRILIRGMVCGPLISAARESPE
jgi:hypothetical protein